MIDVPTMQEITSLTLEYWRREVATESFAGLASGAEIGHRIADYVEERTTQQLAERFTTRRQRGSDGRSVSRSMGDVWVLSNGIYNPINIKAGEADRNGQPNIVSLRRLLRALLAHQIDSYYLLIVKVTLASDRYVSVFLIDVLDYLDYVTFDSGPGQMMLRERRFYQHMASGAVPVFTTVEEKVERLFRLLEDGDRRLIANRAREMEQMRRLVEDYKSRGRQEINQDGLNLL